jgi:hypothetical protein
MILKKEEKMKLLELGCPFRDLLSKKNFPVNFHLKNNKNLGSGSGSGLDSDSAALGS